MLDGGEMWKQCLGHTRIGLGQGDEDLCYLQLADIAATQLNGYPGGAQARLADQVELDVRQASAGVTFGGAGLDMRGELVGEGKVIGHGKVHQRGQGASRRAPRGTPSNRIKVPQATSAATI
ncbi:hypothetical protein D3C85_974230 [compost metagenome]